MRWLCILLCTLIHNFGWCQYICIYSYSTFHDQNFEIWVYKQNLCPFISIVLFYGYKFSKMDISKIYLFL